MEIRTRLMELSGRKRWSDFFTDWRVAANCTDLGDYYFFARDGEQASEREKRECAAKSICAECLVLDHCRRYALDTAQSHGIWGGLTGSERRLLRDGPDSDGIADNSIIQVLNTI
ncbi:WhiB family transcriptional regulator [Rhodococcus erythropolis]|uniref:WhiB family transcriptional regulator n=1 Tax=Rhodococcus erythropolis TaxID=1833 RepID=UPI00380884D2